MKVSALQSFLGWVGETNADLVYGLANIETRMLKGSIADIPIDRPIFICGLARAGTTILLELLAQHPDTGTFRYQDYPFPMLPTWWDKMNWARNITPVERSHKDGITVTPESPEAMEEMIWMHFFPDCHDPKISNVLEDADAAPELLPCHDHQVAACTGQGAVSGQEQLQHHPAKIPRQRIPHRPLCRAGT